MIGHTVPWADYHRLCMQPKYWKAPIWNWKLDGEAYGSGVFPLKPAQSDPKIDRLSFIQPQV